MNSNPNNNNAVTAMQATNGELVKPVENNIGSRSKQKVKMEIQLLGKQEQAFQRLYDALSLYDKKGAEEALRSRFKLTGARETLEWIIGFGSRPSLWEQLPHESVIAEAEKKAAVIREEWRREAEKAYAEEVAAGLEETEVLESGGLNRRYDECEFDLCKVVRIRDGRVRYTVTNKCGELLGHQFDTLGEAKEFLDDEVAEYEEFQDEQEYQRKKVFGCDCGECEYCKSRSS